MIDNKTTYAYDALKRLTNVTFDSPTPETPGAAGVKSRSITLDKLDNILKITDNENAMVTEIFGELEGQGRLLNQYSRFNGLPLEHDKNGNLSAKGSRLFAYDYKNRLVRSSRGDDAVTFTYDVFGRQTSRTDLSGTQRYFYAGDQKIEERNASGQVTKHYLWGNGIDELLRLDIYNGNVAKPYYVHTDSIGSTTTVTDENGNVVERVRYDAYGVPSFADALGQTLKKSTVGNTTLFQGREYDYDLALYNYRARFFDPTLGRFLQTDPLGYQDSMNLYQGMNMNPGNFVDPWGEVVNIQNNGDIQTAYSFLKFLLAFHSAAAGVSNNLDILEKSQRQYFVENGTGMLSPETLGEFQIQSRSINGQNQEVGVIYLNVAYFLSNSTNMRKKGREFEKKHVLLNRVLKEKTRFQGLANVWECLAQTLAHESAHAVEAENKWSRASGDKATYQAMQQMPIVELLNEMLANGDFQKYAQQNSIVPAERLSAFLSYIVKTDVHRADLYSKYLTTIQNSMARDKRIDQEEATVAYPYGISVESLIKKYGFQIWQTLSRTILSSVNYLGSILGFN